MKGEETWESSRHWTRSERVGGGATVRSGDVRWVLMAADYRLKAPTLWKRLRAALRFRHRLAAARITN